MNICLEYLNGRMKEFNTSQFVSSDALTITSGTPARNLATEFDLRLDLLGQGQGLRLDVWWHNTIVQDKDPVSTDVVSQDKQQVKMTRAHRRVGYSILLANETTLRMVSKITVEAAGTGHVAAWRQGTDGQWMINGKRAAAAARNAYKGEAEIRQMNENVLNIIQDMDERDRRALQAICEAAGYPVGAYEELLTRKLIDSLDDDFGARSKSIAQSLVSGTTEASIEDDIIDEDDEPELVGDVGIEDEDVEIGEEEEDGPAPDYSEFIRQFSARRAAEKAQKAQN